MNQYLKQSLNGCESKGNDNIKEGNRLLFAKIVGSAKNNSNTGFTDWADFCEFFKAMRMGWCSFVSHFLNIIMEQQRKAEALLIKGVGIMGQKNIVLAFLLAMMVIFVVACDEEPQPEFTATSDINQVTQPLPSQTLTVVPSATAIPLPSETPVEFVQGVTPAATETPRPDPTLTATPSPISIEPFMIREPEIAVLDEYLLSIATEEFPFITPLTEIAELLYEDVNGDGEIDLIVSDFLRVIVLLWNDGRYSRPFMITRMPPWKYTTTSRVQFIDYTNDSVPEIVFDHQDGLGGTGLYHSEWTRYIIHCSIQSCITVWEGQLAGRTSDFNAGGMDLFRSELHLDSSTVRPILRYLTENFSIYSYGEYLPVSNHSYFHRSEFEYLTVFTSTLRLYEWNNNSFEFQREEIVSLPRQIQSAAILEAQNGNGNVAAIKVTEFDYPINQNDRCELFVDGELIGEMFGCKFNFTTVEWKDINGNGRDEIVVTALSGTFDPEDLFEIDANCFHQRFLAYEWDGQNTKELINTYGCVVQEDLFGVKLEDFDLDGQNEIIAARWYYDFDCPSIESEVIRFLITCFNDLQYDLFIYKWNGTRFVFWDSVFGSLLSD